MEISFILGIVTVVIGLILIIAGLAAYIRSGTVGGPDWSWALLVSGFGLGIVGIVLLILDSGEEGKDVVTI